MPSVRVSAKSAALRFWQCGPECLARGCTAKCCDAPTRPDGCFVVVHCLERAKVEEAGGHVAGGYLRPRAGERGCPYKQPDGLCGVHGTEAKPFGCIASPFMLTARNTLVVRNRYKLLPCYAPAEGRPAWLVFYGSLLRLFGRSEAQRIAAHLEDEPILDVRAEMCGGAYAMLKENAKAHRGLTA